MTVRQIATRVLQSHWGLPALIALLAGLAVVLTIDPADCFPRASFEGPGITMDESFNVQMGVYLARAVTELNLALLHPDTLAEVFGVEGYNPDHPPLGRLWLGAFHLLAVTLSPPDVEPPFVTVCARTGSAAAFALTVFVVGLFTGRHWGRAAGAIAALSVMLMPRLFGHAHLASLETVLNLVWCLAVLGAAHRGIGFQPVESGSKHDRQDAYPTKDDRLEAYPTPSWRTAIGTGVLLGFVALTKIQFVLLPPLFAVWAVWHWRSRAVVPFAVWGATGAATFFIGWPWLWLQFPDNLLSFLGRSTQRVVLHCFYFGESVVDRDVSWHYPLVMLLVTVPVGILALGVIGLASQRRVLRSDAKLTLVCGAIVAPLLLFSLNVAVYDGERLFLMSFPLWAALAGIGGQRVCEWLTMKSRRWKLVAGMLLASQAMGVVTYSPYWLSYYNGLVGGLSGAAALGFEVDYWGESLSRSFWRDLEQQVPPGSRIAVAPIMHQFYVGELSRQCPIVRRNRWQLEAYDPKATRPDFLVTFERRADVPSTTELDSARWQPVFSTRRQGVPLATLWTERHP